MDSGLAAEKTPKKRGRPLGSGKKKHADVASFREQMEGQQKPETAPDDVQAYTMVEENLSPFSNLLRRILSNDRAKIAQVARELEVVDITVYRWMSGSSEPRQIHLKRLPEVLPEHRSDLIYAINETFPDVLNLSSTGIQEVGKDIYLRVMELLKTTIEDDTRFWQISQAIFEYALQHLDPDRLGLAITYASLMPPHEDGIHSLYESTMRGNFPWPFQLEAKAYLGSTTLAGTAAMLQRMQTWSVTEGEERLQVDVDEFERSAAACPVMRAGRIAGVLIVSSTQPKLFSDPRACDAVGEYAQLFSIALREADFYAPSLLHLRPMPELKWQRAEINRTYAKHIVIAARKYNVSRPEAEQYVLSEMETEFEELAQALSERQHRTESIDAEQSGEATEATTHSPSKRSQR